MRGSGRRVALAAGSLAGSDLVRTIRKKAATGLRPQIGLGVVASVLLISALFVDSGTDDDPSDGHFGFAADGLQPSAALVIYAKPRDDYSVPTGS